MSEILDRLFGPEQPSKNFPPLNQAKIIPFHDCEYVESRTWGWGSMVLVDRCSVCLSPRPPTPEEP